MKSHEPNETRTNQNDDSNNKVRKVQRYKEKWISKSIDINEMFKSNLVFSNEVTGCS